MSGGYSIDNVNDIANDIATLHWSDRLKIYNQLKESVKRYATSGIKKVLLDIHPDYSEFIEDIVYIRPYHNDFSKRKNPITMPCVHFDDGTCVEWYYSTLDNTLLCTVKDIETMKFPEDGEIYLMFGAAIYQTLLHADLISKGDQRDQSDQSDQSDQ